jgi:hypothetical protein
MNEQKEKSIDGSSYLKEEGTLLSELFGGMNYAAPGARRYSSRINN